ncbi:MAG: TonB-dependent receptor, partial [Bacteroidota bacterium]
MNPNRSWEFNVRQNGYDIAADPFGYPEAYYSPPLEAVESIRIIRGSASLQFGPQFGGLLDYCMKSGDSTKKISLESQQSLGSYGLFSSYNSLGGELDGFNYFISYHHRSAEGWRMNSDYETDHFYSRLAYRPSSRMEASLELTVLRNKLQQPGGIVDSDLQSEAKNSTRSRNWLETPWNNAAFRMKFSPLDNWEIDGLISTNIAERNSVGFVSPINVTDSMDGSTGFYSPRQIDKDGYVTFMSELRSSYRYQLYGFVQTFSAGIRYHDGTIRRLQKGVGSTGTTSDFSLKNINDGYANELEYSTGNMAFFAEHLFHIGERLIVVPGFRLENLESSAMGRIGFEKSLNTNSVDQQLKRTFLLTGIGLEWQHMNNLTFHANVTTAYRP